MKVAIAGAAGQIGRKTVTLLLDNGHEVRGLARKDEQLRDLEEAGAEGFRLDLEADGDERVREAVRGADAVIFTAGAGPGSGDARKETMDYGGAVKLIEACRSEGVRRYLIVSSMGYADPGGAGKMENYLLAKLKADVALQTSDLDYTIIRPGRLTDDEGTGRIDAAPQLGRYGEIPRADVAAVLLAALESENTVRRAFEVLSGETEIPDALSGL
ncbi:NADH(P)-binding [Rubrobacter radiotolerans]|uniref:NADH(P)-binding n=1 Tax=Rubrobacter radiotolerans TaxID=42256 RepID=A0A023WZH7_RUBRA|nr:SDR family oxidoreductase [Rubrobacter radiotolerans]AHY45483.1 NADH(P)-binding [Rubrobacter radiotolerans]MDX5892894.1 SDR family oxidoreductase [Rubrobacter radiotolerans]SMC02700.1 NAD(P)H-binding [Rubrobacter radiotolerans DSM 5868]